MDGFDVISTSFTWPTIEWWMIAAAMFGIFMAATSIVFYIRREPKAGTVSLALFIVPVAAAVAFYLLFPSANSVIETTHVIASGQIIESQETDGETPALTIRLDTDPTWPLVLHGDDIATMRDATGNVTLQCDWGVTFMECRSEQTGAPRPLFVPWFAEVKEYHSALLPAVVEGE